MLELCDRLGVKIPPWSAPVVKLKSQNQPGLKALRNYVVQAELSPEETETKPKSETLQARDTKTDPSDVLSNAGAKSIIAKNGASITSTVVKVEQNASERNDHSSNSLNSGVKTDEIELKPNELTTCATEENPSSENVQTENCSISAVTNKCVNPELKEISEVLPEKSENLVEIDEPLPKKSKEG